MKTIRDNEGSIFTTLRELPLLKGVSQSRLQSVVGHTPMHFLKFGADDEIVAPGQDCTHLKFIVNGSVRMEVAGERLTASYILHAPQVIAPDYLFGRTTKYPCRAVAISPVGIMQITKEDYRKMLMSDQVFLFNYLNFVSTNSQKGLHGIMSVAEGTLEERIALWVVSLTQPGSTDVVLRSDRRDLYSLFGATRSAYFSTLEHMRERGIVDFTDSHELRILSRPALLELITLSR